MSDSFCDSQASIVQYQIVFIKRDWEALLHHEKTLVTSNMNGNGFTSWKVAEFIQAMINGEIRVPTEWMGVLDEMPGKGNYVAKNGIYYMTGLREDDKRYLRVTYQVLDVLSREALESDNDQIKALEAIANALRRPTKVEKTEPPKK